MLLIALKTQRDDTVRRQLPGRLNDLELRLALLQELRWLAYESKRRNDRASLKAVWSLGCGAICATCGPLCPYEMIPLSGSVTVWSPQGRQVFRG